MDKKTSSLLLRLSAQEKDAFEQCAEIAGVPVSAWIRERLRFVAVRELESAGKRAPFIKPISLEHDDGR